MFRDDLAPGMKGFVEYNGNKSEMARERIGEDYASFSVPIEALDAGKFTV